jgi:lauroyl/myristoyl acyltransferase
LGRVKLDCQWAPMGENVQLALSIARKLCIQGGPVRNPLYNLSVFKFGYASAQLIPRPIAQRIADGFAWWSLKNVPELRGLLRENLGTATGQTGEPLEALVRENVRTFSKMLADYFLCAGDRCSRARELVAEWKGLEHLDEAKARGKGTILITGHLGHWELGGLLLALSGVKLTVVTLPEPTPELMCWREAARRRLGIDTIAVGPGHDFAFVEMLRVLRNNGCLAMLVDRPYSGNGMPVQQFGKPTQFSTAAAMLAHHTGASVIPAFVLRRPDSRYVAEAGGAIPMIEGALRDTLQPNVQRIADLFASLIRKHPEQWFNYVPVFSAS